MDFSDYYILPESPLPAFWRMSEQALVNAYTLERTKIVNHVFESKQMRKRVFGSEDEEEAKKEYKRRLAELS